MEENRPPGTASSAGSQRELLPVSSCRRGTPPTDSQLCILDASTTHDSKQEDRTESSRRHRKKHRIDNSNHKRRVRAGNSHISSTPSRVQYDLESSSSVVARVTATATVTVQVKTEQIPNERTVNDRSYDSNRTDERMTVVDMEDHDVK